MALGTDLISHYTLDSDLTDGVGSNDLALRGGGGSYVAAKLGNGFDNENTGDLDDETFSGVETDATAIEVTIDMWINIQTAPLGNEYVFQFKTVGLTNGAGNIFVFYNIVSDRFQCTFYDQSVSQSVYSPVYGGGAPTSTWVHVLAWFDQSEFGLLIDNANESSLAHNGMPSGTILSWDLYLQNNAGGSSRMDCIIDNVGIWERKLTSSERDTRYNAGTGLAYPFPTPGKPNILIW